jgi:hypothetical protein
MAGSIFLGLVFASTAAARTVEYLHDMTAVLAAAEDQGITGPFSDVPASNGVSIVLKTPAAADHRVVIASTYCQAYNIDNPVSTLLQELVAEINRTQPTVTDAASRPPISLRILSGSTLLRCMGQSDFHAICKNRVRITAEASVTRADGSVDLIPVVAQVQKDGRVGGLCGNIARYTGIVTREAGIELIHQARNAAGV